MRYTAFLLLLAMIPLGAYAEQASPPSNQAPFGLSWGMSTEQVRALGIELTDSPVENWGKSFEAAKLPKVLSDAEYAILSFGFDDRLWRIGAASRSFGGDPAGAKALARYDELNTVLTEKYGKGKQVHIHARYSQPEHFTMHIKMGEGQWFTDFDTPQMTIQLGIGARSYSTTFWRLIFENKTLAAEFEEAMKKGEKSALLGFYQSCLFFRLL